MSVPKFEEFLYPFLVQIKDRDLSSKEMRDALIAHFGLTEADCALKTKSGTNTQVNDRINWVRQYLRRALFVDLPQKGVYHITERGKDVRWVIERYTNTVKPMYLQFIEPSKRYADIIIPQGGHNRVAINMILNTVEKALRKEKRSEQ